MDKEELPARLDQNDTESANCLLFLEHNIEPFDKISFAWKKTFLQRQSLTKNTEVHQFFTKFPVLRQPFGYKLLVEDFENLHPGKSYKFLETWPNLTNDIISLLELNKLLPVEDIAISSDLGKRKYINVYK